MSETQRILDGMEARSDLQSSKEKIRKAQQRLRKVVSKLRRRIEEAVLDVHFVIIKGGPADWPNWEKNCVTGSKTASAGGQVLLRSRRGPGECAKGR